MRLSNLIASGDGVTLHGDDRDIAGITADSRKVEPGFLFVAIPGTAHDGRTFTSDAIKRGATAILMPRDSGDLPTGVSVLQASDVRIAISSIAARFYPKQPETIVAITGTSGKTSTAQFTREIWQTVGHKSASIGTLGLITKDEARYGSLTTPDAITLHSLLNEVTHKGVTHLAMEASSHGLSMNRLDHVHMKAAAFTNLSRDHLDFHGTMENYLQTKQRLFSDVLPHGGAAVLNADSAEYEKFAQIVTSRGQKIISYGQKGKDITLLDVTPDSSGQLLNVNLFGKPQNIRLPVIGKFQAWNGLCALGLAIACGDDQSRAAEALGKVSGVPGRMQLVGQTKNGAAVFVDYAHKPDALENVLTAIRPHVAAHQGAKLGVVFGCGGNRDRGKRPIMGEIAGRLADWAIVTDDNPRNEDPASIRREILTGRPGLREIGDRAKAIASGIEQLQKDDILIIAGKGHESGQIVGDKTLPFDDADVARQVLGS